MTTHELQLDSAAEAGRTGVVLVGEAVRRPSGERKVGLVGGALRSGHGWVGLAERARK